MVFFPNCKINLGLRILSKRQDGFHSLETVFYPLPLEDALEIIRNSSTNEDLNFSASGFHIAGDANDNLCIRAFHLLKKEFPQLPPVQMHLHKAIPMGAGLGGGSSDGAFTLKLLNEIFHLSLSNDQLISYALDLGSDCPFFILNKPCVAKGRGDIIEEIKLDLSGYNIVLINPGIHVNTGMAFKTLNRGSEEIILGQDLKSIISLPVQEWKNSLVNDFEAPVFAMHPLLAEIKNNLYEKGALYAAMSGSGSTVFGLFSGAAPLLSMPGEYFVKTMQL